MKRILSHHYSIAISLIILMLFSCSESEDMREAIKKQYGDPDLVIEGGYSSFESVRYVYADSDINRIYDFQRSASGCGGSGEWYVYRFTYADYLDQYPLYTKPVVTHTPVEAAPIGNVLQIKTTMIDVNNLVVNFDLYYKHPDAEDYQINSMISAEDEEDVFLATISGEEITEAGIEYYIELNYYIVEYDRERIIRLPETGFYTISAANQTDKPVYGEPQTSYSPAPIIATPQENGISPVGP